MAGSPSTASVGVGLKSGHKDHVLGHGHDVDWFEVHAENYMGEGGPLHAFLEAVRSRFPVSIHGVGMSIGGSDDIDREHLGRFAGVIDRYQPHLVSEHLAWSTHQGQFFNDLLAVPYNTDTLACVAAHVDLVQERIGRTILIENPSTYIEFDESEMDEVDFLSELVERTDCGLLLDINNVYVSCVNHGWDASHYLQRFPLSSVGEIHLAGHAEEVDQHGNRLLIDAHDRAVADAVWDLYRDVTGRIQNVPSLIEWDNNVPEWQVLAQQAEKARIVASSGVSMEADRHVA